jgi:hypothetical protein
MKEMSIDMDDQADEQGVADRGTGTARRPRGTTPSQMLFSGR